MAHGLYTERGIKGRDGYGAEIFLLEPEFAIKVDSTLGITAVLVEPASIVAKAWRQIDEIAGRSHWRTVRVLIAGAGPVGLLAALMAKQRAMDLHVIDVVREGTKPALIAQLGGEWHSGAISSLGLEFDVIVECTGVAAVVLDSITALGPNGILCLTGLSARKRSLQVNIGEINRSMVLKNQVIIGSVNAARRDYEAAANALTIADKVWLRRMLSIRVPLAEWRKALNKSPLDIKAVIEFSDVDSA